MRQSTILLTEGFVEWETPLIAARLVDETQAIPVQMVSPTGLSGFGPQPSGVVAGRRHRGNSRAEAALTDAGAPEAVDHARYLRAEHRVEWEL